MEERRTDSDDERHKKLCSKRDEELSADREPETQETQDECEHSKEKVTEEDTDGSDEKAPLLQEGPLEEQDGKAMWLKNEEGGFVPGKIAPVSESIFSKPGMQRQKKSSSFLSKSSLREAPSKCATKRTETVGHWVRNCRLSYLEEGDCIDIGTGEAHIKNHSFVFVRDLFKDVVLSTPCRSTQFRGEKHSVFFRAKGRRSTGESFEMAEREYVMDFHNVDTANEFLDEAKK